ncbi:uncharacterized protein H6S33_010262 [Morchella sextelata]|uniref:uncharacterized protein n=1 Tax=Morchella sextelata TaxID=1174677 RepID=UPI001D04F925|nr:uncharacterized protein H6S33_010262 [Morchella sextelata]KAH0612210.1 hypothetical protein H6S33_010262 [Morchella sextelata]
MAMSTSSQGIWHQELIDGKQVWHFYPSHAMTLRPNAAVAAAATTIEAPPPVTSTDKIIVHPPGQFPAGAGAGGGAGGPQLTYNVYNTYNYPAAQQEAKKEVEAKKEQKQEGIMITEEEVRMDALLHEQAEALRMRRHLQTVDYGAGDVYGRRILFCDGWQITLDLEVTLSEVG